MCMRRADEAWRGESSVVVGDKAALVSRGCLQAAEALRNELAEAQAAAGDAEAELKAATRSWKNERLLLSQVRSQAASWCSGCDLR